jgi:hypothetical protein
VWIDVVRHPNWHAKRRFCLIIHGKGNCPHIGDIGQSWPELFVEVVTG